MDDSNTILILKGASEYGVLRKAIDLLGVAFQKRGYQIKVVDLMDENSNLSMENIVEEILKPYAFIFACQSVGCDITVEKNGREYNILDLIETPFIGWNFDHPEEHLQRIIKVNSKQFHLAAIDQKHVIYMNRFVKNLKNVFFLPHGGFVGVTEPKPFADREIDIFCPGTSGTEISIEPYVRKFGETIRTMYQGVFQLAEENPDMAGFECIEKYITDLGMEFDEEGFEEVKFIMNLVDVNSRHKCKIESVKALLKAGKKVVVAGSGWEELKEMYPDRLEYIKNNMEISEVIEYMQNSKVVLNLAPTLTGGLHERILTGLLAKAAVITPYNSYCAKTLEACKSLYFMEMKQIDKLPQIVEGILQTEHMEEYTTQAKEYLLKYHTWEKRSEEILDYVEKIKHER